MRQHNSVFHQLLQFVPWDRFDRSKLDPEMVKAAKAACMVEHHSADYGAYLRSVFPDDPEFCAAATAWAAEEIQHGQVLRRYSLAGSITAGRARAALEDYAALPIARYPHLPLLARAFSLRANMTFYDALYVALAEAADATLLTCDRRLAAVVPASVAVALL